MAYTKTITDADNYFKPNVHLKAGSWDVYSAGDKQAALAQAQRVLELHLNSDASDPATTDRYRWDYAIFEQALFMLEELPKRKTSGAGVVVSKSISGRDKEYKGGQVIISVEAQRFLGLNRRKVLRA